MNAMCRTAALALATAGIFLPLTGAKPAQDTPPPIRTFDIPTMEKFGREIYAQDQLAWKATDLVIDKRTQNGARRDGLKGWITESTNGKDVVRFMHIAKQGPEVLYDVTFAEGGPIFSIPANRTLSSDELAQYSARMLALQNIDQPCSDRYNTVALKDPESGGWLVWALASTDDADLILIGGHYRFTISPDGKSIRAKDALSRGCLRFSKREGEKEVARGNGTGTGTVAMSHIVSLTPVEIHAFASLTYQTLLYVGTNDGKAWKVDKGLMTNIEQDAPGLDGFSARNFAGVQEECTVIVSKQGENPKRYYLAGKGMTKVISATEYEPAFSVKLEAGYQAEGLVCSRMDIVPAPNDYKIVQAGMALSISDRGTGHADRMGKLELVNGEVRYTIIKGDPLTDDLAARVKTRLEALQSAIQPKP